MIEPIEAGYALYRFEVYNWGTFDKRIWQIAPERFTALLTGANGSGKSTLVDGMLSLLVPGRKRSYNQASGDNRRERSIKSYVRGAYSRLREASGYDGQVQYLRDETNYSVLLAVFHSPGAKPEFVTIAQVFTEGGAKVDYFTASIPLSIQEHFAGFETLNALRRRLRGLGVQVNDQFNDYSSKFRGLLGLRSEKALELFNQTVSIKEIGSLNQFVRDHMLERTNIEQQIQLLRDNYENLTKAHEAILKAQRQRDLLLPIHDESIRWQQIDGQIEETTRCERVLPLYFAYQRYELLTVAMKQVQVDLAEHQTRFQQFEAEKQKTDSQISRLRAELEADEIGRALQRLKDEAQDLSRERNKKQEKARRYTEAAEDVGLGEAIDAASFHANRAQAEAELPELINFEAEARKHADRAIVQLTPRMNSLKELEADIASLEQRRTQIPRVSLEIREQVARALKIDANALPFAGELLRVREEEAAWEGAIERLLHGFALNLLVESRFYARLSRYVNDHHLNGRLVYQRVQETSPVNLSRLPTNVVYRKVEVHPDTTFGEWLRTEISRKFDYVCCASLDELHHERRGITVEGQIKHDETRYEKDDRYNIRDYSRYVLGWDNRVKLESLRAQLKGLQGEIEKLQGERQRAQQGERQAQTRQDNIRKFLSFEDFQEIDWRTPLQAYEANIEEQRRLEASSDRRRTLQEQHDALKEEAKDLQDTLYRLNSVIGTCNSDLSRHKRQLEQAEAELREHPVEMWQTEGKVIHRELEKLIRDPLSLDNVGSAQDRMRQYFSNRAQTYQNQRAKVEQSLVERIANFRSEFRAETESIGSGLAALPGLEDLLKRIQSEDLPRFERRFKELLDKKMIDNIAGFRADLERQVDTYRDVIDRLNSSLVHIPYETSVYIQLRYELTQEPEISAFRAELRDCTENTVGNDAAANEAAFMRIRALIRRFETDERWAEKVTDVRRWLNFAAEELWRDDHSQRRYHSDSAGMSGGQKAKLAYTILASAVAYQYAINELPARQSFRFVMIDEAFSKVDDANARYAMELFRGLGLQLLVVTPLDKIPVVEHYVGAYHYVVNNMEGNESRIRNLTVEEYQAQRAEYEQNTQSAPR
ncbi:MAG: hypothetical protein IAE80_07780 [Anaerolinea sp.]|nr:hypothetical protein [Anaerolinea sp.]